MRLAISAVALAAAIAPAFAFSQPQNGELTRAQVTAQLVQLEKAGYNPATKDIHYPQSIQQAEARLNAPAPALAQHENTSGFGYANPMSTEAGHATTGHAAFRSLYSHH